MNHLKFQSCDLQLIDHDGKMWLKASDIAAALGYSRTDKLTRIYSLHSAEFTKSMTAVVETPVSGFSGITTETRLFTLRGAHLIGMFARTKNGANFRKWVLDQLDTLETQEVPQKSLMFEWFDAKASLDSQERFASLCGKGLSNHKKQKPPLLERVIQLTDRMQPSLFKQLAA